MTIRARAYAIGFSLFFMVACSKNTKPVGTDDAGVLDASEDAAVDAFIDAGFPDGPIGEILMVPQASTTALPTLQHPVQVVYTEAHVPHIYAETDRDLYVTQGYLIGRDRYFAFELGRRLAEGKLCELLGSLALPNDQEARGRGMSAIAQRLAASLTPQQRDIYDAFAEGLNDYVDAVAAGKLPPPSELGFAAIVLGARRPSDLMQHVTRDDVAAFTAVLVYQLGFDTQDTLNAQVEKELATAFDGDPYQALRRNGALMDIWGHVLPVKLVAEAPAGFGLEDGTTHARAHTGGHKHRVKKSPVASIPQDMLAALVKKNAGLETILHGGVGVDFGSNAWAVSGAGTTDGSSLLSGDGHLPLSEPTLFYQMGLDSTVLGTGATHVTGLFFPGYPFLAVGTNGRVAWSETYLEGDVTDWYAEQIQLDSNGAPISTKFGTDWMPITVTPESYNVKNIPALSSVGGVQMWNRFATWDGRPIVSIEGTVTTATGAVTSGQTIVNVLGQYIIPGDTNNDHVISAVSFDFTGFDISDLPQVSQDFMASNSVREFRNATKRFVAYAQNLAAADKDGNIYYSGYNAMPCRGYLEKDGSQNWTPGSSPRSLLDGTRYHGFTVPLTSDGMPDETMGTSDPYACLIPFDRWPSAISPSRGYVETSNNDIAGLSFDDNLSNDEYYLGSNFDVGYRANTVTTELANLVSTHSASVSEMARIQADHKAHFAADVLPSFLAAIDHAKMLVTAGGTPSADDQRLLTAYMNDHAAIDEVQTRLQAWLTSGANAASGVTTFYNTPSDQDRTDAVAAMIWAQWFRDFYHLTFDDENLEDLFAADPRFFTTTASLRILNGRGAGNPSMLASWNSATNESIFFDVRGTAPVEQSDEVIVTALASALTKLRAAPTSPGVGGFGTNDMTQWLWGLRHLVQFPSIVTQYGGNNPQVAMLAGGFSISPTKLPIAPGITMGDPRFGLPGFPRPGDFFGVDASNPPYAQGDYFYATGPVMRMVISLSQDGTVRGQNVIPGGQSGITSSPNYADQAGMWLGNQTIPIRFALSQVLEGAVSRESFTP